MHALHKFVSPTTMAISIDSFGGNLPFELGPWKSIGAAVLINGRDTEIVDDVMARGYHLARRAPSELSYPR